MGCSFSFSFFVTLSELQFHKISFLTSPTVYVTASELEFFISYPSGYMMFLIQFSEKGGFAIIFIVVFNLIVVIHVLHISGYIFISFVVLLLIFCTSGYISICMVISGTTSMLSGTFSECLLSATLRSTHVVPSLTLVNHDDVDC